MRARMSGLRRELVEALAVACPHRDFGFIARQHGLFSLLGLSIEQVALLRAEHHVYMTDDSRINVAGLRSENLAYFVRSLARVVERAA